MCGPCGVRVLTVERGYGTGEGGHNQLPIFIVLFLLFHVGIVQGYFLFTEICHDSSQSCMLLVLQCMRWQKIIFDFYSTKVYLGT